MGFVVRATDKAGVGVGRGWGPVGGGATIIPQLLSRCWRSFYYHQNIGLGYYQSRSCERSTTCLLSSRNSLNLARNISSISFRVDLNCLHTAYMNAVAEKEKGLA